MLEFIDIEHTPKNILIRAVRKNNQNIEDAGTNNSVPALLNELGISTTAFSTHQ